MIGELLNFFFKRSINRYSFLLSFTNLPPKNYFHPALVHGYYGMHVVGVEQGEKASNSLRDPVNLPSSK